MMLLIAVRSIPIGWVSLGVIVYLLEHPLLHFAGPFIGAQWIATATLGLDCTVMAATGWVVGRLGRPNPMLGVLVFAATLTVWDMSFMVGINVPWLLRLVVQTLRGDGSYLDSLVSTAASQALLFGCLLGGGMLSRGAARPVSIVGGG